MSTTAAVAPSLGSACRASWDASAVGVAMDCFCTCSVVSDDELVAPHCTCLVFLILERRLLS